MYPKLITDIYRFFAPPSFQTRAPKSHHTQDDFRPPNMSHVKDLKLRSKLSAVALADKRAEKAKLDSELVRLSSFLSFSHFLLPVWSSS